MIWILVCLLLSGCIGTQDAAIHKHLWDNQTGKCWICKVSFNPIPMEQQTKTAPSNKDSKQVFIQAIMIEGGLTESEAIVLWEKYKNSNIKGFADYLIELNPFQKIDRVYIDFVERVKARTIILKKKFTYPVISGKTIGILIEKDKNEK